jgi:PAS domain S-box-containing protein
MRRTDLAQPARTTLSIEHWPWPVRALLGCCAAGAAVSLTYWIKPFQAFPLLLAFPTVILSAWYLGMWGGVFCALTDAVLVDAFLTKTQFRFSIGSVREEIRLAVFLLVSILLGWTIRRLARQRSQLITQELQQSLLLANAERQLAEQRASASEALREREDVLQLALRSNGMGLWVWDLAQASIYCSDEMFGIYGRELGSIAPTPEAWMDLVHPEDLPAIRHLLSQGVDSVPEFQIQYRVPCPDGSIRWVETRGRYQRDSQGRAARLVGVSADITGRKQSEEAMLRAEKLAVAGRLAASVAHEINNPLEAVANLLYLITHADTLDSARSQAQQALDELMRVSLITQQTLKFHRQPGTPKDTRLSEIVHTVLALFRARLRSARIEVQVRAEHEVPIACMPGEVQQIVANLISNAIDAMPHGGRMVIRLRPSLDWRDSTTAGMRITLCDTGVGMDRATMQRIFEPFFTTKTETGTGLGMWVVAQLVERHHGQARVWSTQRDGASATAISLFLPMGDAPTNGVAA